MALPGILYGGWRMFETLQKEGNFSVYYKVMGRWYFQIWSYIVLPCAVIANMDDSLLFAALGTMILLPTIIWFWMFFWMLGMTGKETWVSEHELNWEEPLRPNDDE